MRGRYLQLKNKKIDMVKKIWKSQLRTFIVEHPRFEGSEKDIFTPRKDLKIRFWFEGNLQIEGEYQTLEINYNSPDILVLSKGESDELKNIFRVPWKRLVSFELIIGDESSQALQDLIRMN